METVTQTIPTDNASKPELSPLPNLETTKAFLMSSTPQLTDATTASSVDVALLSTSPSSTYSDNGPSRNDDRHQKSEDCSWSDEGIVNSDESRRQKTTTDHSDDSESPPLTSGDDCSPHSNSLKENHDDDGGSHKSLTNGNNPHHHHHMHADGGSNQNAGKWNVFMQSYQTDWGQEAVLEQTPRGYHILKYGGFKYSKISDNRTKTYWRCTNRACRAKLHTEHTRIIFVSKDSHEHEPGQNSYISASTPLSLTPSSSSQSKKMSRKRSFTGESSKTPKKPKPPRTSSHNGGPTFQLPLLTTISPAPNSESNFLYDNPALQQPTAPWWTNPVCVQLVRNNPLVRNLILQQQLASHHQQQQNFIAQQQVPTPRQTQPALKVESTKANSDANKIQSPSSNDVNNQGSFDEIISRLRLFVNQQNPQSSAAPPLNLSSTAPPTFPNLFPTPPSSQPSQSPCSNLTLASLMYQHLLRNAMNSNGPAHTKRGASMSEQISSAPITNTTKSESNPSSPTSSISC